MGINKVYQANLLNCLYFGLSTSKLIWHACNMPPLPPSTQNNCNAASKCQSWDLFFFFRIILLNYTHFFLLCLVQCVTLMKTKGSFCFSRLRPAPLLFQSVCFSYLEYVPSFTAWAWSTQWSAQLVSFKGVLRAQVKERNAWLHVCVYIFGWWETHVCALASDRHISCVFPHIITLPRWIWTLPKMTGLSEPEGSISSMSNLRNTNKQITIQLWEITSLHV